MVRSISVSPLTGRTPADFYGGARPGDIGGPLVKIKHLSRSFPEHLWRFDIVYILSNAAYLPATALELFRKWRIPTVHNQNGVFDPAWFTGDWRARNERITRSYHRADYVFYQSGFCRDCAKRFLGEHQGPGGVRWRCALRTRGLYRTAAGCVRGKRWLKTRRYSNS